MVQEVAHSYPQYKNLGFNAYERSHAYSAAKLEISKRIKSSEVSGYLYVDYQHEVRVQDLLGHPSEIVKMQATSVLQPLAPMIHRHQPVNAQLAGWLQLVGQRLTRANVVKLKRYVVRGFMPSKVMCLLVVTGLVWFLIRLVNNCLKLILAS